MKSCTIYILFLFVFASCTKVVNNGTGTSTNAYLSLTVVDSIQPYKTFIVTTSDGNLITSLGYINSVGYYNVANGATDIRLQSQLNGSIYSDTVVNLAASSINTAFAYNYGIGARLTIVQEDYTTPANGFAKVRLLNLWSFLSASTADFTISDGTHTFTFSKRYFLDHEKVHSLESFILVPASNYTLYTTIGTSVYINPFNFNLLNGKIYTIAIVDIRNGQLISPVIQHN